MGNFDFIGKAVGVSRQPLGVNADNALGNDFYEKIKQPEHKREIASTFNHAEVTARSNMHYSAVLLRKAWEKLCDGNLSENMWRLFSLKKEWFKKDRLESNNLTPTESAILNICIIKNGKMLIKSENEVEFALTELEYIRYVGNIGAHTKLESKVAITLDLEELTYDKLIKAFELSHKFLKKLYGDRDTMGYSETNIAIGQYNISKVLFNANPSDIQGAKCITNPNRILFSEREYKDIRIGKGSVQTYAIIKEYKIDMNDFDKYAEKFNLMVNRFTDYSECINSIHGVTVKFKPLLDAGSSDSPYRYFAYIIPENSTILRLDEYCNQCCTDELSDKEEICTKLIKLAKGIKDAFKNYRVRNFDCSNIYCLTTSKTLYFIGYEFITAGEVNDGNTLADRSKKANSTDNLDNALLWLIYGVHKNEGKSESFEIKDNNVIKRIKELASKGFDNLSVSEIYSYLNGEQTAIVQAKAPDGNSEEAAAETAEAEPLEFQKAAEEAPKKKRLFSFLRS